MGKLKNWANSVKKTTINNASNIANHTVDAVIEVGRAALHSVAPDDIEYYLCSLELIDSDLNRHGFISFIVMPDQISENHQPIQTVTKTHQGIVTTFNDSFAPVDISCAGTFGRKFRIISGMKDVCGTSKLTSLLNLNLGEIKGFNIGTVDFGIKSGYGLTKILEHILTESTKTANNGLPYFLIYKNYSFNTQYVVDVVSFSFSQSIASNMMWNYQFQLRGVAKDLRITQKDDMVRKLTTVAGNAISNGLTKVITHMIGI